MNDIFESEEFLKFEQLCHSKKLSFLVSVTKVSSCHKPKQGPQYVMSDFFVHDVPAPWQQCGIRPTPTATWLNPHQPPPLSLPLSQLAQTQHAVKLKQNFLKLWNHIHGVMTETYFCPKLFLMRIPRKDVEFWMQESSAQLPAGDFISCCDICHFSAFAKWVLTPGLEENNANSKVQLQFLALMIHVALGLYKLDPETHVKGAKQSEAPPTSLTSAGA